jgi:hypothetical protein
MAFAKKFKVEVTVPEGYKAGDTFQVEVEAPEVEKQTRGTLSGLALSDMTDEQIKQELTNANSVLYKAKKRGVDADKIAIYEARVAAVKAEKDLRKPVTAQAVGTATPITQEATPVVSEDVAPDVTLSGKKGKKESTEVPVDTEIAAEL